MRRRWWTGLLIGALLGAMAGWIVGGAIRERFRSLERRVSAIERQITTRGKR